MNRVWLFIPMLIVSLAGSPWLADPARGDDGNACPSADTGNNGRDACPCLESMRAYGECQWYCDQEREHHRGTMSAVTEATTDSEPCCPAMAEAEAAEEATATTEAPTACIALDPADCWYDGATDSYHDYEFSNTEMVCEETEDDGNGSYEFPSETAASELSSSEIDWVEDLPEEHPANESATSGAESYVEQVCPESAASSAPAATAEDVSTEEAWQPDENAEYSSEDACPREGTEHPYGDANESEMGDMQTTEATEPNEGFMEGTQEQGAAQAETNELSIIGPSGEYESSYGVEPYHYEYHPGSDNWPDPAWEDSEPSAGLVEGGDSGAVTSPSASSPSASSAAAEFDGEIILSLARTLDRVGVTLQSISRYLTEMAASDLARRPSESLER